MAKYVCSVCGYEYDEAAGDPDNGIAPGTKWEDIPDDFTCPLCGVGKDLFEEAEAMRKGFSGSPRGGRLGAPSVCPLIP